MPGDIGQDGRHRLAGQRLFGGPEQLDHVGGAHQHQGIGVKAEAEQARPIGQAHFLAVLDQLQIDDGRALTGQQAPGLGQGKTQHRPGMAALIGEHFLQQATGGQRKTGCRIVGHDPRFGQSRLALDIGNSVPERGKALLVVWRAHWRGLICEQNRNS